MSVVAGPTILGNEDSCNHAEVGHGITQEVIQTRAPFREAAVEQDGKVSKFMGDLVKEDSYRGANPRFEGCCKADPNRKPVNEIMEPVSE